MSYQDHIKEQIKCNFATKSKDIEEVFQYASSPSSKADIVWVTEELLKLNEVDIDYALKIAKKVIDDPDPESHDSYDQEVLDEEDPRIIATVRVVACWFLKLILEQFNTDYYPQVFEMLKKRCLIATEPNSYVRRNAAIPLAVITRNLRAKNNADGSPFVIPDGLKRNSVALAYQMLEENKQYPRVMEYLAGIFDGMRDMDAAHAMYILKTFFFKEDGELQPEFVTEHVAPWAIFYAEFRADAFKDGFDDKPFKEFLVSLINISQKQERLSSTLVWLFWKTLEADPKTYDKLKKYLDLFFDKKSEQPPVHQIEFLVKEIININVDDGIKYLGLYLEILRDTLRFRRMDSQFVDVYAAGEFLEIIHKHNADLIPGLLRQLNQLLRMGVYIGQMQIYIKLFNELELNPQTKQSIRSALQAMAPMLRGVDEKLLKSIE